MDEAASNEEPSVESEFATTFKFIDLYVQAENGFVFAVLCI